MSVDFSLMNALSSPTVVGVGKVLVGLWSVQSTSLIPSDVLLGGLPHVSVLCSGRFNYLFFPL